MPGTFPASSLHSSIVAELRRLRDGPLTSGEEGERNKPARTKTNMEVYKIVITVIAFIIVTLLSVLAEMLGTAQETRRNANPERRKPRPDIQKQKLQGAAITSTFARTRVDGQQNQESPHPEVRKRREADSEQDR